MSKSSTSVESNSCATCTRGSACLHCQTMHSVRDGMASVAVSDHRGTAPTWGVLQFPKRCACGAIESAQSLLL
eukprot:2643964-Amphidinium_carterae.2